MNEKGDNDRRNTTEREIMNIGRQSSLRKGHDDNKELRSQQHKACLLLFLPFSR